MIRKLIIALAAFAIVLAGFSLQGGGMLRAAEAADASKVPSDCAGMADMGMKGDHDSMDCPAADPEHQDSSMKCPADNCTLRCGTFSAQLTVSFVHYRVPAGVAEHLPTAQVLGSLAGEPPLRPPRPSILA